MSAALKPPPHARDYAGVAEKYVRDVIAGRVVACKWVKLACQRHLRDLKRSRADKEWPYVYDAWHANDVCDFAEKLPHIEGKWAKPTIDLEAWQVFGLSMIFGWRRRSDGGRRFAKVYWEVARKNAKSTLAAAVTLYCFCCEDEPAPYVFIGATTGDQARKVFHPARQMVLKTPDLAEAFGIKVWSKSLTEPGGGYVQTINAKGSTQDGHNPHLAVLDELHAHKDRALYDVMSSAMGARSNPLLWVITTAGFDTAGVCYEQRIFVTKVLGEVVEAEHYFGLIYTLDEGDDPFDPKVWVKANPNLGVSVQVRQMESEAIEARGDPGQLGNYLTKRMNVWSSASSAHVNIEKWRACNGEIDLEALRNVPCWGGYDLAATSDLTSFRLVWWLDGKLVTWGVRYLPEAAVEPRTARNSVPYARWAREKFLGREYLTITPGEVTDYAWIERDIRKAMADFDIKGIGFDPWNSHDLNNRLMADGAPLVEVRQGHATLAGPMQELDRLYLSGRLVHGGDEVLAWCASNVVARPDENGNLVPSKKRSHEKIDDYAALLNALTLALKDGGAMDIGSFLANPVFG